MSIPIETNYFIAGSCASDGTVERPDSTPFRVYRHGPTGVHFWDWYDQNWKRWPATNTREGLIGELLAGGLWVRELSGRDLPRDVPNYDRARFGS